MKPKMVGPETTCPVDPHVRRADGLDAADQQGQDDRQPHQQAP